MELYTKLHYPNTLQHTEFSIIEKQSESCSYLRVYTIHQISTKQWLLQQNISKLIFSKIVAFNYN